MPTFVIAARLENLRATAQQVHLTHGAVSQQIQLLEQAVGYPLFERRGRGVRLNAAGKEMLAAVEPALQALQQGVARARRAAANQTLRISVLPSLPITGCYRACRPSMKPAPILRWISMRR